MFVTTLQLYVQQVSASRLSCHSLKCVHGICKKGRCQCDRGWQGSACDLCGGRVRLSEKSGYITDGDGEYNINMQCTWLIDSKQPNSVIMLKIVNFETEFAWDHLYIFDGGSVFSPLLAAYSGVMLMNKGKLPEIVAYSGRAYLYFKSDAEFTMNGFNISYSINSCPRNCSEHGLCKNGICTCQAGWTGEVCDIPMCPPGCASHGHCDEKQNTCVCDFGYTGSDCSFKIEDIWWEEINTKGTVQGRAFHQSVIVEDAMWVVGGENFDHKAFHNIAKFNFSSNTWEKILITSNEPSNRFGHSVIEYENSLYMYGGMLYNGTVKNELWKFDIAKKSWTMLIMDETNDSYNPLSFHDPCKPLGVVGHTATLVSTRNSHKMIVIFGHNPLYGYLNNIQEYDLTTGKWKFVQTKGAIVKGGFGHTSVYDRRTQQIYVYGGYHSNGDEATLVDFLYAYNLLFHTWRLLAPSNSPLYMHSAVIHNGLMLIYGGNAYMSTSNGGNGFSSNFLLYDIGCETWQTMKLPARSEINVARYGHTAVLYNESMYIFGGFNGQMLNDIRKFNLGICGIYLSSKKCHRAGHGATCSWDYKASKCNLFSTHSYPFCGQKTENFTSLCARQTLCPNCIENTYNCVWCGTSCSHERCSGEVKENLHLEQCEVSQSSICDNLHNCHACHTEYYCGWQKDDKCYTFVRETNNRLEKAVLLEEDRMKCELPCSSRTSCESCMQGPCLWCSSPELCIESNSYAAVFAAGQCMRWTTQQFLCPGLECEDIQTCDLCQKNPLCGWCDTGGGTGLGRCYKGSDLSVMTWNGAEYMLNETICPLQQWYFTSCPACQCNGHSTCRNGTDVCRQPCHHFTEGPHCENCMARYYGYPTNGRSCTPCFCNNYSHLCHLETGTCYCNTKGVVGKQCDRCDKSNQYVGNPTEDGGSCYYNLSIDFQYTFNISKPKDKYYTNINLMNVPTKPDIDVEFTITCVKHALVNVTISSASSADQLLINSQKCGEKLVAQFSHVDHLFGADNTTFHVNVYDFSTPFVLYISFSQHPVPFSQQILDLLYNFKWY